MTYQEAINKLQKGEFDSQFIKLYGEGDFSSQRERWTTLVQKHRVLLGEETKDISLFSTPGRTELAGNHTDHNRGYVLAGSINLDTIAAVSIRDDLRVQIESEGYPPFNLDLSQLEVIEAEEGSTDALIRGIAAAFVQRGYKIGGFTANFSSTVLRGSGLSSSAALEVLIGTIFSSLFNGEALSTTEIAQIGQWAENNYFNKPCGLMDQVACANGGIVSIDFKENQKPVITPVEYDFFDRGYTLMVVDTGGNHADLTPDYASIPSEMKSIAAHFDKDVCREISEVDLLCHWTELREKVGDRAILRAFHFFNENKRVIKMIEALKNDNIKEYLNLVKLSGHSSFCFLQNVYSGHAPEEQGISLALALSEAFLEDDGACRVHGGGFAGTIQVYVPNKKATDYREFISGFFGENSVTTLRIRPQPSTRLT